MHALCPSTLSTAPVATHPPHRVDTELREQPGQPLALPGLQLAGETLLGLPLGPQTKHSQTVLSCWCPVTLHGSTNQETLPRAQPESRRPWCGLAPGTEALLRADTEMATSGKEIAPLCDLDLAWSLTLTLTHETGKSRVIRGPPRVPSGRPTCRCSRGAGLRGAK